MTAALNYLIKAEIFSAYFNKSANAEAQRLYLEAIKADPNFARPCADLAYAILQAYLYNWYDGDPGDAIAEMNKWAQEAMNKDPNDPYNLWVFADVRLYGKDFANAANHYATLGAPQFNKPMPAEEWAFMVDYADLLLLTGDPKQAVTIVNNVLQKGPPPERWFYWVLAWAHYIDGDYPNSLKALTHFRVPRNAIRKNKIASLVGYKQIVDAKAEAQIFLEEEKAQGITYAVTGQPVLPGLMLIEDRVPLQDPKQLQQWKDHLSQAFAGIVQP
jgi:hypothetical protein